MLPPVNWFISTTPRLVSTTPKPYPAGRRWLPTQKPGCLAGTRDARSNNRSLTDLTTRAYCGSAKSAPRKLANLARGGTVARSFGYQDSFEEDLP